MQTGSLINLLTASKTRGQPTPEPGMGATLLMWSDRHAYTIDTVSASGKRLTARRDNATRTDDGGMTDSGQTYDFSYNPDAAPETFSLRVNGRWIRSGEGLNGTVLRIGERYKYHDFSF